MPGPDAAAAPPAAAEAGAPPEPRVGGLVWGPRGDGDARPASSAVRSVRAAAEAAGSAPGSVFWLDVLWPDDAALEELADAFDLDPNAIEDTVAYGERPKATRHRGHLFITAYATTIASGADTAPDSGPDAGDAVAGAGTGGPADTAERRESRRRSAAARAAADRAFANWAGTSHAGPRRRARRPAAVPSRLHASRVSAFVLPQGVITVRRDDRFDIGAVMTRKGGADAVADGPYGLLHLILDAVVDGHLDTAEQLDDALEDIEDGLFDERVHDRHVQRTNYRLRKELVHFRRLVLPMRDVVTMVIRHRGDHGGDDWSERLRSDYSDLFDHVLRVVEWSESLRELVTTIFETNLSLQDARLNTVMKKLTGWAAIIAVPTAVTGWFGQNVPYPGSDAVSGLIASTVSIVVLAAVLFVVFRRKDWI